MPQDLISQFDRKYALPIETYRQVQNITQRNNIPDSIRWEGMIVHVLGDQSYILLGGIDDTKWEPLGGLVNVNVVDNLLSTSSTDALSANQGRVLQTTKLSDAPSDGNTYGRLDGAWAVVGGGAVDSVFGRTGAVVAQTGDYTFAQIGSKPTTLAGYGITDAVPTSRTLTAGTGLTGGGSLAANRSFALDTGYTDGRYLRKDSDNTLGVSGISNGAIQFNTFKGWQLGGGSQPTITSFSNGTNNFFDLFGDLIIRDNTTPRVTIERTTGNLTATGNITATNFIGNWNGLDSTAFQTRNEKGTANGYTPLDSGAKVPIAYLPDSVIGQVQYQGTWAASTNTPTLANPPSAATKGHYYVASDNGTQFGISFQTGDWIISNGTAWEKVDNTDAVTSVFGRIGAVVANAGDYTFAQIGSKPTTLSGYGITDAVPTSRTLTAGTGLTGGGNLTANRSFALDTGYTDGRYVQSGSNISQFNNDAGYITNVTWNTITGLFNSIITDDENPTSSGLYRYDSTNKGFTWHGRFNPGGEAADINVIRTGTLRFRGSVDSSTMESTWYTVWHDGNLTPSNYVPTSRTLTAGDGLTGGGSLAADRTFAVDGTVVRTTGTQSIGGAKTFTSNVIGSGTFTGTNFILSSDRRLKKDIRDYSPTPLPIKWRTFDWKSGSKNQIGVIAQEVQEVAPHLVEKAKDGTLSVRMIDLLVAKVAELEARIINLER